MDTVLVTGACGFVGPYVIEELLRKGYKVRATDLPDADFRFVESLGCELAPADLLKREQARSVMESVDGVVHTAARMVFYLDRESYERANYHVTVNTCDAAVRAGVKSFVHFSSADVYGPPCYSPADEDHPQRPNSLYGIMKTYGERAAFGFHRERGLPLSVLRPCVVYGPRCTYTTGLFLAVPVLLRELGIRKMPLPRRGFVGHFIHAEDCAGAAVFLMENESSVGEAYNLSDDSPICLGEIIELFLDSVGIDGVRALPVPDLLVSTLARVGAVLPNAIYSIFNDFLERRWDTVLNKHGLLPMIKPRFDRGFTSFGRGDYAFENAKIKALGYELRYPDLRSGWGESVKWFMDNGWIPDYG
jgi:nucleoside-diphosphate-sugar epimerase